MSTHQTGDENTTLDRLVANGTARTIRERAGYTATDFAGRVGVASRTLRAWEEGKSTPRQPYAKRKYLAELLLASRSLAHKADPHRGQGR